MKLQRLIDEAGTMCNELSRMEKFPISQGEQTSVAIASRREEIALSAYQEAKRKFFDAAIAR